MLEIRKVETENQKRIVVSLFCDARQEGLAYGTAVEENNSFYLQHLSVDNKQGNLRIILWFLEELFLWLRKEYGIHRVIVKTSTEKNTEHPLFGHIRRIPFCRVEKIVHMQQIGLKTRDFSYWRRFHWYCPKLLEEKQYEAVRWKDCDMEQTEKIRKAELEGSTEADYLSPGVWETGWEYDEKSSFALLKKGRRELLGWIITEKMGSGQVIKLRRFYIYKEARKKMLGPAFVTWVLDKISQQYEELYFDVVRGNRQMEMFVECYCKPVIAFRYYSCNAILELV